MEVKKKSIPPRAPQSELHYALGRHRLLSHSPQIVKRTLGAIGHAIRDMDAVFHGPVAGQVQVVLDFKSDDMLHVIIEDRETITGNLPIRVRVTHLESVG